MKTERIIPELALYLYDGCRYCDRVRQTLAELELSIEERDIRQYPSHAEELRRATGKSVVPVLRIDRHDGTTSWISESKEIVDFLRNRYGRPELRRPEG